MDRTRTLYLALMCASGVAAALIGQYWPAFRTGPVPPMMWILIVSLLFDVAAMNFGRSIGLQPLTMGLRFGGVLSGAILYMLLDFVLTRGAAPAA
jgi:hypothetical protein